MGGAEMVLKNLLNRISFSPSDSEVASLAQVGPSAKMFKVWLSECDHWASGGECLLDWAVLQLSYGLCQIPPDIIQTWRYLPGLVGGIGGQRGRKHS